MIVGRLTRSAVWTAAVAVALVVLAAPGAARADGLQRLKDYLERLDALFDHCHYKLTIQSEYFGAPGGQDPSGVRYYEWLVQRPNLRMSQLETFYHWDGSLRSGGGSEVLIENANSHTAHLAWRQIRSEFDAAGVLNDAEKLGTANIWRIDSRLRGDLPGLLLNSQQHNFEESNTASGDIIVTASRRLPPTGLADLVMRITFSGTEGRVFSIETFSTNEDFPVSRVTVEEFLVLPEGHFPVRLVWERFAEGTDQVTGRHTFVVHDVSIGVEIPAEVFTFPRFVKDLEMKTSPTQTAFRVVRSESIRSGGQVLSSIYSSGVFRDGEYVEIHNTAAEEAAAAAENAAGRRSRRFLDGARLSIKWSLPLLGGLALVVLLLPKVFRRARKWERE